MQKRALWVALLVCGVAARALSADVDVATVARLVHEPDPGKLDASIQHALRSPDAQVRSAAARVAAVRNVASILNPLRTTLDREFDIPAAREEARALVMLGGWKEVDRTIAASDRLGKRFGEDVAAAAARLGTPALDLYFTTFRGLDINAIGYFRRALWGQPERASAVAAKLVEARDEIGLWSLFLVTEDEARDAIDPGVLASAIALPNREIVIDAVWYALRRAVMPKAAPVDERIKRALANLNVQPSEHDLLVGVELLRRAAKLPRRETRELKAALATSRMVGFRFYFAPTGVLALLTDDETAAMRFKPRERDESSAPMPFALPSPLPPGLGNAVIKGYGCDGDWTGDVRVTLDRSGRVLTTDVAAVRATESCRRALDTLLRLSLAENQSISAPLSATSPVLRSRKAQCFDEAAAKLLPQRLTGGFSIRPPRIKAWVRPEYPPNVPRVKGEVGVEVVVSETGCVRTARLTQPAKLASVNEAALLAVAQWTFEPAAFNSRPFEYTTDVAVEFRP